MKQLNNKDLPHIKNKEDLTKVFSLLKMHFDSNPKMYTRNDFMLLINSLYASTIYASDCNINEPIDNIKYCKNITYSELTTLRDNSQLIPGMLYRIIDYITTTIQENTQSANHQFDIIVTADSENTLNENARAIQVKSDSCIEQEYESKLESDFFVEWGVSTEPETGISTLCIYKTNVIGLNPDSKDFDPGYSSADYPDIFFYKGNYEYNGESFDVWLKCDINNEGYHIKGNYLHYYFTTTIVENGSIKPDLYDKNTKKFLIPFTADYGLRIDKNFINYFSNSNLSAWELKYSLDNDTTRFAWADTVNGKGVIYYMKDEYGNEAPYDFKNILFLRSTKWFSEHSSWCDKVLGSVPTTDQFYYTFTWVDENNSIKDLSIVGNASLYNDEGGINGVFNNIINPYSKSNILSYFTLPDNIFISTYEYDYGFLHGCHSNTIGNNCYSNTFGNMCESNTFGDSCSSNTFGNSCYSNTFRGECYSNTFGDRCAFNTLGYRSDSNTFGNDCYSNTFGDSCYSNTFGNSCSYNTFGIACQSNTFGNDCSSNTFGNDCYYNISSYSEGTIFESLLIGVNYQVRYNKFDNRCSFNNLYCQSNGYLQNYHITAGVSGANKNNMNIILLYDYRDGDIFDLPFKTTIAKKPNGKIIIYSEADLIADQN